MELTDNVKKSIEALKKRSNHSIQIVPHRDHYYIYEYKVKTVNGIAKRFSFYLGSMGKDGTFTEARHRFLHTRAKNLDQCLSAKKQDEKPRLVDELIYPDEFSINILRELSMDSRITAPEIARKLGTDTARVRRRIKQLEWAYKIKYTLELRPGTFRFLTYVIFVKFTKEKPDQEKLKELLEDNPRVQLAAIMEGDYNLILYILAENNLILEDILYEMRSNSIISKYSSVWYVNYSLQPIGWYIPFRDKFFDLLKERIWHRSIYSPRRQKDQFLMSEYAVLKELNSNANINFKEVDAKYNLKEGNANYTYYKLLESKIINRPTIAISEIPNMKLEFLYLIQKNIEKFNEGRIDYLDEITKETDYPSDRFVFVGDVSSPYGIALIAPIFNNNDTDILQKSLEYIKGVTIKSARITRILFGDLGIRKFDMKESSNYELKAKLLKEKYKTSQ